MLLKCSTCGTRISKGWLFLALPWSKYTCARCGSVLAGTVFRTVLTSIAAFVLGYILLQVLKGRMSPLTLLPAVALTLVLFLFNLPRQIKMIGEAQQMNDTGAE